VIGRLFGRKPNEDPAPRPADRLITSRETIAAAPEDARANAARIDAALAAAVDTIALSPDAAHAVPVPPVTLVAPAASASAAGEGKAATAWSHQGPVEGWRDRADQPAGASPQADAAHGREGGADAWLADAFDLLFAEEQGEAPASLYGGSYGLTEADLDRIAGRVVDRFTRGPMADAVSRIVTEVAERLVREEIAKIRDAASAAGETGDPL
jgi:hypothetical protein